MIRTLLKLLFSFFILSGINSFANGDTITNLDCPTVSISYASSQICNSNTFPQPVIISGTGTFSGGTFTVMPSGLSIDTINGTIMPSSSAGGVFTITYTIPPSLGCPSIETSTTVTIVEQPNAGTGGSVTVAETSTSTINLFSLLTGSQLGGTWTRTSGTGGTFSSFAATFTPAIGATTSTFMYSVMGSAPCPSASTTVIVFIQSNLSSTDFAATKFSISPNPVQDFMNIESDFAINKIKVFNQIGQLVIEKDVNATQAQLDFSFMSSGLYNVLLETEKGIETTKIIKE
jgi:Secretion system C-terminal sorting domain